jgi:hypothetical protein
MYMKELCVYNGIITFKVHARVMGDHKFLFKLAVLRKIDVTKKFKLKFSKFRKGHNLVKIHVSHG